MSAVSPAGYSGTPLARKLGIKPGARLALIGAPDRFGIEDLPDGVSVSSRLRGARDVIVSFHIQRTELTRRFPSLRRALDYDGGLWIAWPKRSAGVPTDLTERIVRELGLEAGLVDNKVCAIDETWSALRFVYRLADRPPART